MDFPRKEPVMMKSFSMSWCHGHVWLQNRFMIILLPFYDHFTHVIFSSNLYVGELAV